MNKSIIIFVLILAFIGGFLLFYKPKPVSIPVIDNSLASSTSQWETKTDEQAGVTLNVTPSDISLGSVEWKFDIAMNTHSVELNQDMTKVAVLVDDQGKEYKPISWQGAESGGHHREGVLIFNQITPTPKSIELKITGIGGVVRNFVW